MNTKSREVQLNRTKELVHTEKKEKKRDKLNIYET